jgi:hypothetical protein
MQQHQAKLSEREQVAAQVAEQLDIKLDERIADIRTKMNARLDELSHGRQKEIMSRILALSEQL